MINPNHISLEINGISRHDIAFGHHNKIGFNNKQYAEETIKELELNKNELTRLTNCC